MIYLTIYACVLSLLLGMAAGAYLSTRAHRKEIREWKDRCECDVVIIKPKKEIDIL